MPPNLHLLSRTNTSISVAWELPNIQNYDDFKIIVVDKNNREITHSVEKDVLDYTVKGLAPGEGISVRLMSYVGDINSNPSVLQANTGGHKLRC